MLRFGLCAALALCVCGLPGTAAAERFGQWSLDQPGDFIFALSSKRTISFDDRTANGIVAKELQRDDILISITQLLFVYRPIGLPFGCGLLDLTFVWRFWLLRRPCKQAIKTLQPLCIVNNCLASLYLARKVFGRRRNRVSRTNRDEHADYCNDPDIFMMEHVLELRSPWTSIH